MHENIVYLKLVTGEDIVAYVEISDEEYILVHRPIQFFIRNTVYGAVVRSAKWVPFSSENDFVLKARDVILILDPTKDIEDYYIKTLGVLDDEKTHDHEDHGADVYNRALFERYSNTSIKVH